MMVDILCGPPFAFRQEILKRSVGKGIGHFLGAMRIDGFIEADEFKSQSMSTSACFAPRSPRRERLVR